MTSLLHAGDARSEAYAFQPARYSNIPLEVLPPDLGLARDRSR